MTTAEGLGTKGGQALRGWVCPPPPDPTGCLDWETQHWDRNGQGFASDFLSHNCLNILVFIWASPALCLCTQIKLILPASGGIRREAAFPLGMLCQLALELFAVFCRLTESEASHAAL